MKFLFENEFYEFSVEEQFKNCDDRYVNLCEGYGLLLDIPALTEVGISPTLAYDYIKNEIFIIVVIDGDGLVEINGDDLVILEDERHFIVENISN